MAQEVWKPQIMLIKGKYSRELLLYATSVLTLPSASATDHCQRQDAGWTWLGVCSCIFGKNQVLSVIFQFRISFRSLPPDETQTTNTRLSTKDFLISFPS